MQLEKIDKTALIIAAVGPLLWVVDAFVNANLSGQSFFHHLFFPSISELSLRVSLIFLTGLAAMFFHRYTQAKTRVDQTETKIKSFFDLSKDMFVIADSEGRIIETNTKAEDFWGFSRDELLQRDVSQLGAQEEADRLTNFIQDILQKSEGVLSNVKMSAKDSSVMSVDIRAIVVDDLTGENKHGIFLDIAQSQPANLKTGTEALQQEAFELKLSQERSRIEKAIRDEEEKKAQEKINALEQQYSRKIESLVAGERSKIEEELRQEGQRKIDERLLALQGEVRAQAGLSVQERSRIEEEIRLQEEKKAQEAIKVMEQKYAEMVQVRVAEQARQIEEMVRFEESKKAQEQIKALEAKHAESVRSEIIDARKQIEEAVRQEELKKSEEAKAALRQQYDELVRVKIEEERQITRESIRQEEEKKAQAALKNLDDKYAKIEETARQQEQQRAEEQIRRLKAQQARELEERIAQERKVLEESLRQDSQRIDEEKKSCADAAREEERKKAVDAIKESEKKHAEALAAAQKTAEEQLRVKAQGLNTLEMGKLVKGLAQQVTNPLAAVINNIKMINIKLTQEPEFKPADIKGAITAIEENASLCRSILTSLASMSSGSHSAFQEVSLNDLVVKIDGLYGKELKLQSIAFTKQLQNNLARVQADPTLLFLALFNLLTNAKWAIKANTYSSSGGTITIKTQKSAGEGFVELVISDDGVGISGEDLKHIFEPFFTGKKEGEGLGLGLTIVSEIIKVHNGEIHVESQPGHGTTVTIQLPALAEKEA